MATLLLFCEEREAFWILATVIEDKLSVDFYSRCEGGLGGLSSANHTAFQ